jgi:hypothetical protein
LAWQRNPKDLHGLHDNKQPLFGPLNLPIDKLMLTGMPISDMFDYKFQKKRGGDPSE